MAATPTLTSVDRKVKELVFGPLGIVGAKFKVFTVASGTYAAGGVVCDLSPFFSSRIYGAWIMNPTVRDASTGYVQAAYVPGTAKTDGKGGWSPADGKIQISTGATENTTDDQSAHVIYLCVLGS